MSTVVFILIWLLAGSVSMNILWIILDKETLNNFYLWKKRKSENETIKGQYLTGFILGLLCGPFSLNIEKIITKIKERCEDNE